MASQTNTEWVRTHIKVLEPDYTRAMIRKQLSLDSDSEIAAMSLRVSLICPLGKSRIQYPCRAITCAHVQCFDAVVYLRLTKTNSALICPVCDNLVVFKNLVIDGLFEQILQTVLSSCNEVQFKADGSWTPVIDDNNTAIDLSDSEEFESENQRHNKKTKAKKSLFSDSEFEDEFGGPLRPRIESKLQSQRQCKKQFVLPPKSDGDELSDSEDTD